MREKNKLKGEQNTPNKMGGEPVRYKINEKLTPNFVNYYSHFFNNQNLAVDITIIPAYTCNICQKEFRIKEDLDLTFLVICSKKCEFKFIFRLIKKQQYSKENYELLLNIIGKEQQNKEFNENLAIYEITKYYQKRVLSNIKTHKLCRDKGQDDKDKGQDTGLKDKGTTFLCICNIHKCPLSCPKLNIAPCPNNFKYLSIITLKK